MVVHGLSSSGEVINTRDGMENLGIEVLYFQTFAGRLIKKEKKYIKKMPPPPLKGNGHPKMTCL